jgi:hypothetical protein
MKTVGIPVGPRLYAGGTLLTPTRVLPQMNIFMNGATLNAFSAAGGSDYFIIEATQSGTIHRNVDLQDCRLNGPPRKRQERQALGGFRPGPDSHMSVIR